MCLPNIFFVGKAGSGKTYAVNYLVKHYGYVLAKFAYPVYNLAYNYFDMKNKDRKLLQVIGTDVAREQIDNNLWVNRFKQDIRIVEKTKLLLGLPVPKFALDDCRFINEYEILKGMGWVGFYLDVSDDIRFKRLKKRDGDTQIATLNHKSEVELDQFKNKLIVIDASKTLQHTYNQLDDYFGQNEKI